MSRLFGWDIGGVHLKVAFLDERRRPPRLSWRLTSFEIWKDPGALAGRLQALRHQVAGTARPDGDRHAVTMTAELSDVFAGRADGVRRVLAATRGALGPAIRVLASDGRLVSPRDAAREPHRVAAANWVAPATVAARALGTAGLLVDVGSTTTDIVPFSARRPAPRGRTDLARLARGELVYTGVLRTPPEALADRVPVAGGWVRPAPEHFAIMADVWRLLGRVTAGDYTVPTPDGRGRSVAACAARLARLVCAEPRELGRTGILRMARHLARCQLEVVAGALREASSRPPRATTAVVAGSGAFLAAAAARRAGLRPVPIHDLVHDGGRDWGRVAPAACLALLLRDQTR